MEDLKFLYLCQQKDFSGLAPYFKKPNATLTINEHMFKTLTELNKYNFSSTSEVPHLDLLPDGAITFYQATKNNLTLKLQINDQKVSGYHRFIFIVILKSYLIRSNGVTKYRVTTTSASNKTSTKSV